MLEKQRIKTILTLSLPIIGGMVSQNILNLIDTAMVGRLGTEALAAVGIGSFAIFLSQAIILGLSSGVQSISSRRIGEKQNHLSGAPLDAGIIIAIILGLIISFLLYPFVPELFNFLNSNKDVAEFGIPYWRIRLFGVVFVGINYSFRGFFNGVGQPKKYMSTLVLMHVSNIIFNYLLIYGNFGFPEMGVSGAAWASTISTFIGTIFYFYKGTKSFASFGALKFKISQADLLKTLKLSLPSGGQQFLMALGITSLFWMIGKIGVPEVAAANILINILMICILPGLGFGMASATLVGTSLGKKDVNQAKEWAFDVVKIGGLLALIFGAALSFFSEEILYLFINESIVVALAKNPLEITGIIIFLDVMSVIFMNSLLGSGDVGVVLKTNIFTQWGIFFPVGIILVLFFKPSLLTIWLVFCFSRLIQGVVYFLLWSKNRWGQVKL